MATLTNPIRKQNLVDRFADFVANHNNNGRIDIHSRIPKFYELMEDK